MLKDKNWTMNCVLAGVKVAKMIEAGHGTEAQTYLMELTSEFTPKDVEYLLYRIKTGD